MEIRLPVTLTGTYTQYDDDYNRLDGLGLVIVQFGDKEITRLPAVKEPYITYDARADEEYEDQVVSETIANWLREKLG